MSASAIKKPMLAGKCDCPEALRFPVLATPKLDGIRCLKIAGQALTRSLSRSAIRSPGSGLRRTCLTAWTGS